VDELKRHFWVEILSPASFYFVKGSKYQDFLKRNGGILFTEQILYSLFLTDEI